MYPTEKRQYRASQKGFLHYSSAPQNEYTIVPKPVAQSMDCEMLERSAVKAACSFLRREHRSNSMSLFDSMICEKVKLTDKQADRYIIPPGPANLVLVITDRGMVSVGAFDVAALGSFASPAARVRPTMGRSINTIKDLLAENIKDANTAAAERGTKTGMICQSRFDVKCLAEGTTKALL